MVTPFRALLAATTLAGFVGLGTSGAAVTAAPRVTLVADSVGGVLFWQRHARDELARGIDLRIDIRTCRRLVTEGCVYDGERPPSALDAIRDLGPALGQVAVIDVGYNDPPNGFAAGIDDHARARRRRGRPGGLDHAPRASLELGGINDQIRAARKRWPQLAVGEWELETRDHEDWFADGIHMNWDGGREVHAVPPSARRRARVGQPALEGGSMLTVGGPMRWARAGVRYVDRIRTAAARAVPPAVKGLPAPLRVRADGTIVGKPKAAGTYSLGVEVVDAAGIRNGATVVLRVVRRR